MRRSVASAADVGVRLRLERRDPGVRLLPERAPRLAIGFRKEIRLPERAQVRMRLNDERARLRLAGVPRVLRRPDPAEPLERLAEQLPARGLVDLAGPAGAAEARARRRQDGVDPVEVDQVRRARERVLVEAG